MIIVHCDGPVCAAEIKSKYFRCYTHMRQLLDEVRSNGWQVYANGTTLCGNCHKARCEKQKAKKQIAHGSRSWK